MAEGRFAKPLGIVCHVPPSTNWSYFPQFFVALPSPRYRALPFRLLLSGANSGANFPVWLQSAFTAHNASDVWSWLL